MKRIGILIFSFILPVVIYASFPTFHIVHVEQSGADALTIVAEFNSNGYSPQNHQLPTTWFEYGVDRSHLDGKTMETPRVGGRYLVRQRLFGLTPGRTYYILPMVKSGNHITRGEIIQFHMSDTYNSHLQAGFDRDRIEFTDDGYVKKNFQGGGIYTFSDFWKELTSLFRGGEKRRRDKNGELSSQEVQGDSPQERKQENVSLPQEIQETSYNTKYHEYYNANLRASPHSRVHPVSVLPFLLFLLILAVLVTLIYLFRKKGRTIFPYRIHFHQKKNIPPIRRVPSPHKSKARYNIPHEPIDEVRKRME